MASQYIPARTAIYRFEDNLLHILFLQAVQRHATEPLGVQNHHRQQSIMEAAVAFVESAQNFLPNLSATRRSVASEADFYSTGWHRKRILEPLFAEYVTEQTRSLTESVRFLLCISFDDFRNYAPNFPEYPAIAGMLIERGAATFVADHM